MNSSQPHIGGASYRFYGGNLVSFIILTDTSANLPSAYLAEHQIGVVPFNYFIKDKAYSCLDTEGFDAKKFYKAMRMGADVRTSQINLYSYIEFFEPYLKKGDDILMICMSSGISGSYHCAEAAKKELGAKYPDRKILLIDTLAASLGEGIFVLRAVDMRKDNKSIDEVYEIIQEEKKRMYQVFTVDDLMYLKKTGRVKGSVAIVGNMLHVKPLLKGNENGEIVNFAKTIGRKRAIDGLAQKYNQLVKDPETQVVGIAHADCEDDAKALIELLNEKKPPKEILTVMYEPVTGSHVGPGTLALFFLGDDDVRSR